MNLKQLCSAHELKIGFLTGPCPEGQCGVGDYTRLLVGALEKLGLQAKIIGAMSDDKFAYGELSRSVREFKPDVVHLQYPTVGFGVGLIPQLFSVLHPVVLTAHEFYKTHLLRRLAFYPLWLRTRYVIFTTESNRTYTLQWAPWLERISSVVPLSANIPVASTRSQRVDNEVIHFGLVRPNKGIEEVLEFAGLAKAEGLPIRVRIIGNPQAGDGDYLQSIQQRAKGLPVEWEVNLPADMVACRLARATLAYQPFPDGASEKRASLLAVLANRVPVITTRGRMTPSSLDGAVCFSSNAAEAVDFAKRLIGAPAHRDELATRGAQYAQRFSWEGIAESHLAIYKRILGINANCD